MTQSFSTSFHAPSKKARQSPSKRLSLAVKELDKLINRANQLAHLSEQPFPNDAPNDEKGPTNTILSTPYPVPTLDKHDPSPENA